MDHASVQRANATILITHTYNGIIFLLGWDAGFTMMELYLGGGGSIIYHFTLCYDVPMYVEDFFAQSGPYAL